MRVKFSFSLESVRNFQHCMLRGVRCAAYKVGPRKTVTLVTWTAVAGGGV